MEKIEILEGNGYQLALRNAPVLVVWFLESRWNGGISAATAARILNENGYVAPRDVSDRLTGRVLGVQSSLKNWGELAW